ncbi:MAG: SCO1664 family protein [Dehalococcoidia bacterium]|nr:SCO1664 family protein [Dehalococcoidia bacterium]
MSNEEVGFAEAETLLLEGEFADCRPLWYSSNYVYLARLCDHDARPFAAVYKPRQGETPLWDFPAGTLYRREVAAYRLSRLLGWPIVPPTVVREGPQGTGSLQLFVVHDQKSHFFEQRELPDLVPQLQRIALFDFVANNADRKGGHCLLDVDRRVWGIDHGLCFHEQYKLRTVIWDWAEETIPSPWLEDVEGARVAVAAHDPAAASLVDLLSAAEVEALEARMARVVATGRFPTPGPHRSYPWPLV